MEIEHTHIFLIIPKVYQLQYTDVFHSSAVLSFRHGQDECAKCAGFILDTAF